MSFTAERGHTLPQSCGAFKLGNKCWCSEQSTGAEAAAVGSQGTFWSLFHMGTPGSNLQQTEPQVSTRATSAHRSLISINDRNKSQGLQCSHGSLESQHGHFQVVKHRAKAYSSSRAERGVHMMQLFDLPVAWHLHKSSALVKKKKSWSVVKTKSVLCSLANYLSLTQAHLSALLLVTPLSFFCFKKYF